MNGNKDFTNDRLLQAELLAFHRQYGTAGLKQALQLYRDMRQEYVCSTKKSVSKIHIGDIYYMEIQIHHILIHTYHGTYHKYGSLNKELQLLADFGFVRCSQNCIVSLKKIRTITRDTIILLNGTKIHISRKYAPMVLIAFSSCKEAN